MPTIFDLTDSRDKYGNMVWYCHKTNKALASRRADCDNCPYVHGVKPNHVGERTSAWISFSETNHTTGLIRCYYGDSLPSGRIHRL